LEWVNPPFGEHFYIEPAVAMGLKLSPGVMTWRWKDRELPIPAIEANRSGPPPGPVQHRDTVDGVPIYIRYDQPYAAVYHGEEIEPCVAAGSGGWLEVKCNNQQPGQLVVKENMWTGWKAWIDRERTPLLGRLWLEVEAPEGKHTYTFRYYPWDVPLGLALCVVGVIASIWFWFFSPRKKGELEEEVLVLSVDDSGEEFVDSNLSVESGNDR
jgi:hypothetical protein